MASLARIRVASWSLRRRLLAAVLLLSSVGLLMAGFLATASLRSYLLDEVDRRLQQTTGPLAREVGGGPPQAPPSDRVNGPAAFYVRISDPTGTVHDVRSVPLDDSATPPQLPDLTTAEVAEIEGEPFTVHSDGPSWRVIAWTLPDGSGSIMFAASLGSIQDTLTRLVMLQLAIGLAILAAIALVGRWLVDRGLAPLTVVQDTASSIAAGQLDQRVPFTDPKTEVGALGTSFNTMLDRLQDAFEAQRASEAAARQSEERMRQFVADASHELRTPLTTVRGFAELHRMGALDGPEQTTDAMRRIETESARMGVLVSDLLLLARMDQQRAFATDDVDLTAVAEHAVAAARAAWPQHEFALVHPTRAVHVVGDTDRLGQVLTNLLSNAQRYNPVGRPIEVLLNSDSDRAVIVVRDHGPGVAPEMRQQIFERFVRADDARARTDGGAGLGLSIVSAIVAGHNGQVSVEQTPGGGATFVVRLPAAG